MVAVEPRTTRARSIPSPPSRKHSTCRSPGLGLDRAADRRSVASKAKKLYVTRAEFDRVIKRLSERGEIVNDIRRELQIQFARIAQLQHELDGLKKKNGRG